MVLTFRMGLNILGLFLSCIVIILQWHLVKKWSREDRIFIIVCFATTIELILDSAGWLIDGSSIGNGRTINIIINTLYYLFQILCCYTWTLYCLEHLGDQKNRFKTIVLASFFITGVFILLLNLQTNSVFYIDSQNVYHRSWGMGGIIENACCFVYPCYCMAFIISRLLQTNKKKDWCYLLMVTLIPLVSAVIQVFYYGVNLIWVGMSMTLLLVLEKVKMKQYREMQYKIMEQRLQMKFSQIQPHFLYNCLTTIENMCDIDVKLAKKGIYHFAKYLRSNLDSLQSDEMIQFEQELIHIKSFLTLEEMQFGEALHVQYDMEITDFILPSLTVQPIVENAVRYGIAKKEEGGTVVIRTREREEQIEIEIEDDGVGFDPNSTYSDERSHVGLMNIKERIKSQVGGSLNISSVMGKGTKIVVILPKGRNSIESNGSR